MFNFFKRTKNAGKAEPAPKIADSPQNYESASTPAVTAKRAPNHENDLTNEKSNTLRKDVVNLLIPETDYTQKTGVSAILQHIMAGNRKKRNRRKNVVRAESCREMSPQKEMHNVNLQRSRSELDKSYKCDASADDVATETKNTHTIDAAHERRSDDADPANFVKALVLQKYANKSPVQAKKNHVSLVYVSDEPDIDEKRHAETLLREIARSIDCTLDGNRADVIEPHVMGATDSKAQERPRVVGRNERWTEPVYEAVDETPKVDSIKAFKDELKDELEKLLQKQEEAEIQEKKQEESNISEPDNKPLPDILESPIFKKKSNLKPPKSDTEGCSDDDRSDCGKKKVTFRKHIVFDDGDQQTDEEVDSSFESLTESSEEEEIEEEEEEEDSDTPDNEVVVTRNEDKQEEVDIKNDAPEQELKDNIISSDSSIKIKIECSDDGLKRISSDNSDSGFLEISDKHNECNEDLSSEVKTLNDSGSSDSEVTDSEENNDEATTSEDEVVIAEIFEPEESDE